MTGDFYPRPTLIYFEDCKHTTFHDVTLRGVPFWTLHLAGCENALISGMNILNDLDIANSDGIDIDHSREVRILGCHIECADDCICMKNTLGNAEYPHTRNVIVSDCTLISTSAAIKIGTEGVDDFENILFFRCIITRSNRGISIQIRDKGCVRNIGFSDMIIETRRFAESWWGCAEPIAITALDRDSSTTGGSIENIRFSNITCEGENGVLLYGEPGRIRYIDFRHLQVKLKAASKWPKHQYDLRPGIHQPPILQRQSVPFYAHGVDHLTLRSCPFADEDIATDAYQDIRTEV